MFYCENLVRAFQVACLFPVLWLLTAVSATTQMSLMDAHSAVFQCIRWR